MSKMTDNYFIQLQEYVYDAIADGAANESDVREHIKEWHPGFNIIESILMGVFDDYLDQYWSSENA